MKVVFTGTDRNGNTIKSNCLIQKEINGVLFIKLNIRGHWISILNESLTIDKL